MGNSSILYQYLFEMFKETAQETIEEYVVRAIAEDYFTTIVMWICPYCNQMIKKTDKLPNLAKIYFCSECDSEVHGDDLTVSIELVFNQKRFKETQFFRAQRYEKIFENRTVHF